ncbi:MAG: hypothetical protein IPP47_32505 [Bryobacterales bacterium]|nr:hypothetical protein [Bryobacterales bacterium]
MPLRNRVDPYGELIAVPDRGTMTGNRGTLHNERGEMTREWRLERWICCELQFQGRRAKVMTPGHYTHLFFLDEATALAAGHRPCAECRRPDYNAFLAAWMRAHRGAWSAPAVDAVLHRERLAPRPDLPFDSLPPGAMIEWDGAPYLIQPDSLWRWTPSGYTARVKRPAGQSVRLLTPVSIVNTIGEGYLPKCGEFSGSLL